MSKRIEFGNILNVSHGIIVHGCNAYGVMGGGIAAQIKEKWPKCFQEYALFCKDNISTPEKSLGTIAWHQASSNLYVANAITQVNYGRDRNTRYVRYDAVQKIFRSIADFASQNNLSVHYPQIGAGLGNGDWSLIHELINNEFVRYPLIEHVLWIYES